MNKRQRFGKLRHDHPIAALVVGLLSAVGVGAGVLRFVQRGRQAYAESQGNGWIFVLRFFGLREKKDK
jgi:hypothetical protein